MKTLLCEGKVVDEHTAKTGLSAYSLQIYPAYTYYL